MKKAILIIFLIVFVQLNFGQFITTWETTSSNQSIIIPTNPGFTYDYDVDWGDGSTSTNQSGNAQHTYAISGIYTVSITGAFPAIFFNGVNFSNQTLNINRTRIKTVQQWGSNNWLSMNNAFSGCTNLSITATDNPNFSQVADMSLMFFNTPNMTVDASSWNVSNVTLMNSLFNQADDFNSDISNWDVSNVTNMAGMFNQAGSFNQDIGNWNVSNVIDMNSMFYQAGNFNQDISNWDVSNVTNMSRMFNRAFAFNQDIGNWNVSNVTDMNAMFEQAFAFNQDISDWDVGNVTDMNSMFLRNPVFDQPIPNWNVSNVTDMNEMFQETIFNQDIGNWDLSSVTTMSGMFEDNAFFNQDIGSWDVSSVTDMSNMFTQAIAFNQNIGNWDVSSVTNMSSLFSSASVFNQNISNWDVSSVTDMSNMFRNAVVFNQDIGNWDVSNVSDMYAMFDNALAFNQDLGNWNIINVNDMFNMLDNSNLSIANYDATLIGWSSQNLMPDIFLGADGLTYCSGDSARTILISPPNNWTILQDVLDCSSQSFINIPDANFEQALIDANIDSDGIINEQMLESDALGVLDLDVNSENISDLTGIEFFTDLETLTAFNNNLSSIDLSQNTNLISALLAINNLNSIDLSNNPNLVSISLNNNNLSSLDLSTNTALTQAYLQNNQVSSLDLSTLALLDELDVSGNNLVELDLSQNTNLNQLLASNNNLISLNVQNGNNVQIDAVSFDATLNDQLTCIEVDDVNYSSTTWSLIDNQSFYGTDCTPANNDCSFAIPIVIGQDTAGTTNSSTPSGIDPNCQQSGVVIFDVWYQFTAPDSGSITLTLDAGSAIVKSAIYEDCNSTSPLACGENGFEVNNLISGQTYYVQVWLEANLNGFVANTENTQVGDFSITVDDSTLATSEVEKQVNFEFYPNPASHQIEFNSTQTITALQIFNLQGKIVMERSSNSNKNTLRLSGLSSGVYFLKVTSGHTSSTQKLIIK